jgi:hypothetical protein
MSMKTRHKKYQRETWTTYCALIHNPLMCENVLAVALRNFANNWVSEVQNKEGILYEKI